MIFSGLVLFVLLLIFLFLKFRQGGNSNTGDFRRVIRKAVLILWGLFAGFLVFCCLTQKDYSQLVEIQGCVESAMLHRIGATKSFSVRLHLNENPHSYGVRVTGKNKEIVRSIKSGDCVRFWVTKSAAADPNADKPIFAIGLDLNGTQIQTIEEAIDGMNMSYYSALGWFAISSVITFLVIFFARNK